ncbi:MAG: hypothetical protein ABWY11_23345, partial [Umezawaea sp.]
MEHARSGNDAERDRGQRERHDLPEVVVAGAGGMSTPAAVNSGHSLAGTGDSVVLVAGSTC